MANALYDSYKVLLLNAGLNLITLNIKWDLVDLADYTFSAAHDFRDDWNGGTAVEGTSGNLGSKTSVAGLFDAADAVMAAVAGDPCEALILWRDSGGADSTNDGVLFLDTGITGMPITPNGGDINIVHNGSGIFAF